jgi:DNA-binding XRE family transcriptional regulator
MGVSKAAVSKWEKGQSYPDITLLPQLAAYFNISVDQLLDYSPQLAREDIWKLCAKLSAGFTAKPFDEVMAECRVIIKEYYSCFSLLYQMAVLFVNTHVYIADKEKQSVLMSEAIALCQRVVSESNDALLAKDALYIQCLCSLMLEEPGDVLALLGESLRSQCLTEDSLISQAFALAGNVDKAKEVSQCGMYTHLMSLIGATMIYAAMSEDNFEQAETALRKALDLIRLYSVEKLDANTAAKVYLSGTNLYSKHGKLEMALDMLEKFADLCINVFFPYKLKGDSFFTDIEAWLDSDELGASLQYDTAMVKQNMLLSLNAQPYVSALHDEPRYKDVVQKLTDFANTES